MIRDITVGQYYRTESFVHRLDPRVKLLGTFLYIIALFVFSSVPGFLVSGLLLAVTIAASRVPLRYIVRGLKPVLLLLSITVVFNLFLIKGEPVVQLWRFTITREGIQSAVFLAIRLVMLIIGSSMMTFTTTPNQLTDGLESLLSPFRVVKLPAHEIAMMMSIALRFIPILLEETDRIMKAQSARCADFESGNIFHRARGMLPILIPLFVAAFRRANELAMAMEARCYRGGEGRTRMKPLKYRSQDAVAFGVFILYIGINIACSFWW